MLLLISGCRFYEFSEKIEIFLPDSYVEILKGEQFYWSVEYCNSVGVKELFILEKDTEKIIIEVGKGSCTPVILSAVIKMNGTDELTLYPAGFIYGANLNTSDVYRFEWEWGFESLLLLSVSQYTNLEKINISKLLQAVKNRAENANHWVIDSCTLIENLISGDFSIYDIRKFRERDIELYLPEGYWLNTNPSGVNISSSSELIPIVVSLYTGIHSFYNKNGLILEIDIKENGDYDFIIYN